MQKTVELIFGKVKRDNRFLFVGYWLFIAFYLMALVTVVIQTLDLVSIILFAVLFPILFRIVYRLNSLILRKINTKLLLITVAIFGSVIICITVFMFLFADNVAINATKTQSNGEIQVSIGKLKGSYEAAQFQVDQGGMIAIPYQATIGDGTYSLVMKRGNEILWEETISGQSHGMIEVIVTQGSYHIQIITEEATDISVRLSSP